jgi:hypothetical protein
VGVSKQSPLFSLLSGDWLMEPEQFVPLHPIGEEILGDSTKYKFVIHKSEALNQQIRVGFYKGNHLRRIIIFINSSA